MAIRINAAILVMFVALGTGLGLKITKFRVPEHHLVDGEDSDELVLHCEYETDKQDEGHILKWMLNGNMIFQWIPDKSPPQAFGEPFKSSIILPNSTQAPLRFKNPNHNFTGKYTCQVTSFETTVSDNGYVQVVDVSRSALKLNHKINEENIDVECLSTDSYPRPVLNFVVDSDILPAQAYHKQRDNGHFDARLTASFKKDDILEKGSKFGCQLIVGTHKFNVSRTDLYDINAENGSSSLGSSKATLLLITISLSYLFNQI